MSSPTPYSDTLPHGWAGKIERDDLSALQTPADVARATVESAERLLGRPATVEELLEMRRYYQSIVFEIRHIIADRFAGQAE